MTRNILVFFPVRTVYAHLVCLGPDYIQQAMTPVTAAFFWLSSFTCKHCSYHDMNTNRKRHLRKRHSDNTRDKT